MEFFLVAFMAHQTLLPFQRVEGSRGPCCSPPSLSLSVHWLTSSFAATLPHHCAVTPFIVGPSNQTRTITEFPTQNAEVCLSIIAILANSMTDDDDRSIGGADRSG